MNLLTTLVLALFTAVPTGQAIDQPLPVGGTTRVDALQSQQSSACQPGWLPTFGRFPGTNGDVRALAVFDDGSGGGEALFVGGNFTDANGVSVSDIAKWDGANWQPLGSGVSAPNGAIHVNALIVFDDASGSGPALFVGGSFQNAGGAPANYIAKWDGTTWSALGSGVVGRVNALTVFDDGNGPALYAGGEFGFAGGVQARFIAKWDGSSWSPLGSTGGAPNGVVNALTVFDDGNGPALYVGGFFTSSSVLKRSIARWDGTLWLPLGSGMNDEVESLTVYDDGNGGGEALYAGGKFTTAGGIAANHLAKWDGSSWSPLGSGTNDDVDLVSVIDDGSGAGPALYAGGEFTVAGTVSANNVAKWNGTNWSSLGSGMKASASTTVRALAKFDDGSGGGPAIFAGGIILSAGTSPAIGIAKWDRSQWSALGNGMTGSIAALEVFDDGTGPALYAAGGFTGAGQVVMNRIGKWDGASWSPLGNGSAFGFSSFAVFDDGLGGGPALYAGEALTVRKWDGNSLTMVPGGPRRVFDLEVFDDGSGPALYAGGFFSTPGINIAKWTGLQWGPLGTGMSNPVFCLEVFDDGSGPALYAAGKFVTAGGVEASMIAKWDGSSWSALGSGTNNRVLALAVFDDGSGAGPCLYAAGDFTMAGQVSANRIAKWDGTSWSRLLGGMNGSVSALEVFDDGRGSGPALYVGGSFTVAGAILADRVAKWDGTNWSPLGTSGLSTSVDALQVFDDGSGSGEALFAAGGFRFSASGDSSIAKWGCPTAPPFTTFCTAKTTLVCGAANISAAGTPSATATSGFIIEAGPVRGCRPGLLLYSNQPTQPGVAFGGPGNGLLCLAGTGLRRAGPIQSHAAMQPCDATLAIDMNQFNASSWVASGCNPPLGQSNPAGFLSNMGTSVNAQMWGRDSVASGQVLSDGIRWAVGP